MESGYIKELEPVISTRCFFLVIPSFVMIIISDQANIKLGADPDNIRPGTKTVNMRLGHIKPTLDYEQTHSTLFLYYKELTTVKCYTEP